MAFSSMPGSNGRVSPPGRGGLRQAANGGGLISARDSKVSRIGFLSIVLIVYSGITLGLIVWNQSSGRGSEPPSAETAWQDDPRQKLPPPRTGGGGGGFSSRTGEDGGRRPDDQWVMGNSGPGNEEENHNRGAVGAQPPSGLVRKDGASVDSGGGGGGLHRGEDGKGGGLVLPGQPPNEDAVNGGDYGRRPGRSSLREGGDTLATSPPMEEPFDVTLVSQTSQNRFWMLPFLCKRWPGPISIAILEEDRNALPQELCSRMIISSTKAQSPEELDPIWYPVNRLRNVAVRAVTTSHFLMTDIDIWPDVNAYQALHMRYRLETERLQDARNAIVFSAFSRRRFCEVDDCLEYANDVPETIADLKPCLETNTCGRFDAANQSGQGTAYVYYWRSMLRQPNQRSLEHIVCFKSHRFEPYLVVRKSSVLPMFDERFSGYGKNKIQWINHLRYSGFSFYVMPVNFVIHAPHPKSVAKTVWEKTGGGKQGKGNKIMDRTFDTFMAELREAKGDKTMVTDLCQAKELSPSKKRG